MRRRHVVGALIVLAGIVATNQVGASRAPSANGENGYSVTDIATIPGSVDIVERSSSDAFLYVVSRKGTIERITASGRRIDRVLDISALTTSEGERGLLGLAFRRHGGSWEAFVNYTDLDGDTVIARWAVRPNGTFVRQAGGRPSVILTIDQPYSNHNGGAVKVGPDNMLYVATGDGGSAGDPERRALDTSSLLGKVLRIDPLHVTTGTGRAYRIPPGNPYALPARREIWSTGLRNPWRFSFDATGNIWIADVGQNEWEEVSFSAATAGHPGGRKANFGWSAYEGSHRYNQDQNAPSSVKPFHEYQHTNGRCSISGGAVSTARNLPGRAGRYLYGDFCDGTVVAVRTNGRTVAGTETVATGLGNITAVVATSRAVYCLNLDGKVRRISVG